MHFPPRDGRTVLTMEARHYTDAEVHDVLEQALASDLDATLVMASGARNGCRDDGGVEAAAHFQVDGSRSVRIGALSSTIENSECVWSFRTDDGSGDTPVYYDASLSAVDESQVRPELREQTFPVKTDWGPYDAPITSDCATLSRP